MLGGAGGQDWGAGPGSESGLCCSMAMVACLGQRSGRRLASGTGLGSSSQWLGGPCLGSQASGSSRVIPNVKKGPGYGGGDCFITGLGFRVGMALGAQLGSGVGLWGRTWPDTGGWLKVSHDLGSSIRVRPPAQLVSRARIPIWVGLGSRTRPTLRDCLYSRSSLDLRAEFDLRVALGSRSGFGIWSVVVFRTTLGSRTRSGLRASLGSRVGF